MSSSRNAPEVLAAAGIARPLPGRRRREVAGARGAARASPPPDTFVYAAAQLGVPGRARRRARGRALGRGGGPRRAASAWSSAWTAGAGARPCSTAGADVVVADLAELVPATRTAATRRTQRSLRGSPDPVDRSRFPVDAWALARDGTTASDLGVTETLFAVGNGYLGLRGNVEEGRDAHAHGTFVNGFHETWPIRHAEEAFGFARVGQTIVNVPDAKVIRLYVDDEPLLLSVADLPSTTSGPSTSATGC